jgi:hypothetical protein
LLLFTIENFDDGTFQYNWRKADRLHVRNGIIPIPPLMTLALTRANSTDPRVLLMAVVEAIRHVLENDGPEEDEMQQRYRLIELEYIPQWLFLASNLMSDEELREWLDLHICVKRTFNYKTLKVILCRIRMLRTILVLELNGWTFTTRRLGNLKTTLIGAVHVEISMQLLFFASGRGDLRVVREL